MSYSNQYSRGNRKHSQDETSWARIMLAAFLFLFLCAAIVGIYEYKTHPKWAENVAEYRERLSTWYTMRKENLNKKVASVRREVGDSEGSERVVNFEFYNTLQDVPPMQVAAQAEMKKSQELKATAAAPKISHAADLEKDLLAAIKQKTGDK